MGVTIRMLQHIVEAAGTITLINVQVCRVHLLDTVQPAIGSWRNSALDNNIHVQTPFEIQPKQIPWNLQKVLLQFEPLLFKVCVWSRLVCPASRRDSILTNSLRRDVPIVASHIALWYRSVDKTGQIYMGKYVFSLTLPDCAKNRVRLWDRCLDFVIYLVFCRTWKGFL